MDESVKKALRAVEEKKRTNVPWNFDEPWKQPYHLFSEEKRQWEPIYDSSSVSPANKAATKPSGLALYSWNIDFMLPFPDSRMNIAIQHLKELASADSSDVATVIFLQETVESDLELLASNEWVRKTFALSDIDVSNWQSGHYGTVTLVDRQLLISKCFRVHYSRTRMERDLLVTDIQWSVGSQTQSKALRLCQTHLESLALEPPHRPSQMKLSAQYMHDPTVDGAVVAGDFNAIQPFDQHLHSDNGLTDAFLELGGSDADAEGGHTWGQQAASKQREMFGTCRMDKVFFCRGLRCVKFGRFGMDVQLQDENERAAVVELGFDKPWITDHLGVRAEFEVLEK